MAKGDQENRADKNMENGDLTPLTLKNGPATNRSCTDIFCCLVFLSI